MDPLQILQKTNRQNDWLSQVLSRTTHHCVSKLVSCDGDIRLNWSAVRQQRRQERWDDGLTHDCTPPLPVNRLKTILNSVRCNTSSSCMTRVFTSGHASYGLLCKFPSRKSSRDEQQKNRLKELVSRTYLSAYSRQKQPELCWRRWKWSDRGFCWSSPKIPHEIPANFSSCLSPIRLNCMQNKWRISAEANQWGDILFIWVEVRRCGEYGGVLSLLTVHSTHHRQGSD